jgi:hypothetical protein
MARRKLNRSMHILFIIIGGILFILAFVILAGWLDSPLTQALAEITQRRPKPSWPGYFRKGGLLLLVGGMIFILSEQLLNGFQRVLEWGKTWLEATDRWLAKKTNGLLHTPEAKSSEWPLHFNRWDAIIVLFFVLIAFNYQLATMSAGYPTVILGGDAANIASFAAGRAYPELFKNDAILGNLNNIGLYVTVHLPLVIWLEKLVGNFGLAYSLLLFPHVFLQYFSYYLLGRVLFHHRYWAFLFTLAASAPLALDGGEVWGVVSDAMPRFTFQVLIPFLLILLLSIWREKPNRWPWVMLITGLMTFIHPVSTPAWALALWLGFLSILPPAWDMRRRIQEMFKLGSILALALLPYISIYLTHHESGSGESNYDLVHYILLEYFPINLLNIPGALNTFFHNTARFGLLWYGLVGLILTFLMFRSERPRLKQMLVWISGIVFVSILVPWVEIAIESRLRMIPLQTELMRGMRYLVPFLFVFWFYPFAELTHRSIRLGFTRAVFTVGTLLTLAWLIVNPPQPFRHASYVYNCWQSGKFICPSNPDHADALTYIREDTPRDSTFVVFLTNRWSGIEVRYLGLRPMVYAFKDRGQLLYTNVKALEQWNSYQQWENEIFSPKKTPTLDEKRAGIVEFARQTGADYILTNFSFPSEAQLNLNVIAIYQNSTYSILKTYASSP